MKKCYKIMFKFLKYKRISIKKLRVENAMMSEYKEKYDQYNLQVHIYIHNAV